MKLIRGRQNVTAELGRRLATPAVALGNFDGVHRGHRRLIETAAALAHARGGDAVALTFDPHPAKLFAPDLAPPLIVPLERRLELLGEAGADVVVVEPFTRELAALEAERFVTDVLAGDLGARDVVVGYDFSFGRGRRGNAGLLASMGAELGMKTTVVPAVLADGVVCSSTKIREFVLEGRIEGAALLLGRPFELTGTVVRGAGRGRTIGVPTANLRVDGELLPRTGIYAARAVIPGGTRPAAVSVGTNPTFTDGNSVTVEAHLLDFDGDLYDRPLRLQLLRHLRDERRYSSVDELVAQIRNDIQRTRQEVP